MKNLTQLLLLVCLALTSSVFSQNTSVNSVKRIMKSVKVIPEGKEKLPHVDTLPLKTVIKEDQLSSVNDEDAEYEYEYEYDNEFQGTKNQLSNTPFEPEVEYEPEYEYESEYEYEIKDNQLSSNSYEEYEYEYDEPVNNSLNDPEAEYEYE